MCHSILHAEDMIEGGSGCGRGCHSLEFALPALATSKAKTGMVHSHVLGPSPGLTGRK